MTRDRILLPARELDVLREVDVVVAGGGAAGVAAAASAARAGASVILVERNGFLGGTMTAATLGGICGLYSVIDRVPVQLVKGFAEEVRSRLQSSGGTLGPLQWLNTASLPYDLFILKTVLEELTRHERLEVFHHAAIMDVAVEEGRVTALAVRGRGCSFALRAKMIVDCTGDAEICALAGGKSNYDPRDLQFPSAMFRLGGVDTERAMRIPREELRYFLERAVQDGYDLPRTAGGAYSVHESVVHLNITKIQLSGRAPDPLDPTGLSEAEREGRRQVRLYLEVFRRYVGPAGPLPERRAVGNDHVQDRRTPP